MPPWAAMSSQTSLGEWPAARTTWAPVCSAGMALATSWKLLATGVVATSTSSIP